MKKLALFLAFPLLGAEQLADLLKRSCVITSTSCAIVSEQIPLLHNRFSGVPVITQEPKSTLSAEQKEVGRLMNLGDKRTCAQTSSLYKFGCCANPEQFEMYDPFYEKSLLQTATLQKSFLGCVLACRVNSKHLEYQDMDGVTVRDDADRVGNHCVKCIVTLRK